MKNHCNKGSDPDKDHSSTNTVSSFLLLSLVTSPISIYDSAIIVLITLSRGELKGGAGTLLIFRTYDSGGIGEKCQTFWDTELQMTPLSWNIS